MKRPRIFIIGFILALGVIMVYTNASAEQSLAPSWIKGVVKLWADGNMSDEDFIQVLQWLVDNKILSFPQSTPLPSQVSVIVNSVGLDGKLITGLWVDIQSNGNRTKAGFTLLSFTATPSTKYTVFVDNYEDYVFDHWDDGSTDRHRTITPTEDTTLTAYYKTSESLTPTEQQNLPEGFSDTKCRQGFKYVQMTGRYTNGDTPYSIISLRLVITNGNGTYVTSGSGTISEVAAHQTKYFDVMARYALEEYASCEIQIDNLLPVR